ncbi:MAG: hypothetical protein B7Y12_04885 [Rhizobiales bacterium 24-66-13]|nr:MAG: hypothetical protein B7Y12_04885 [Rhizobiales bacterium 24-66-13]
MLKDNAVVIEWLQSPISYSGSEGFKIELLAFVTKFGSRELVAHHYLHLWLRQRRMYSAAYVLWRRKVYSVKEAILCLASSNGTKMAVPSPQREGAPMHVPALMTGSENGIFHYDIPSRYLASVTIQFSARQRASGRHHLLEPVWKSGTGRSAGSFRCPVRRKLGPMRGIEPAFSPAGSPEIPRRPSAADFPNRLLADGRGGAELAAAAPPPAERAVSVTCACV